MASHSWVEIQYVPVTVEVVAGGSLQTYASEEGLEIAADDAVYGCWHCNVPLSPESFAQECTVQPSQN